MCDTCGCGDGTTTIQTPEEAREHERLHADGVAHHHHHHGDHNHDHAHSHEQAHRSSKTIEIETDVLQQNNRLAERNRGFFQAKDLFVLNLVSSPGSGKTTLLEKTIDSLKNNINFSVIEGDQQSMQDADRIDKLGVDVVQVNTGKGCHLDAQMVNQTFAKFQFKQPGILMIENVGNLVCPSLFDLGEHHKVVIISVTEGEDKPVKYPDMFAASDICIINKTDLLPYVDFDVEKCKEYASGVQPNLDFFELSCRTGDGLDQWYAWLKAQIK